MAAVRSICEKKNMSKEISKTEYLLSCGIKSGWHDKRLNEYTNDPQALKVVKKYLLNATDNKEDGIGLYLYGANGTGKSHLLNCSFKALLSLGYSVQNYTLDEIVDKFTASWYSDEQRKEFYDILRAVDFLGIDEFGKDLSREGEPNYLPDVVKRAIESIIRYRVQMKLPIWIASNTAPENVTKVFTEDVASLLREAVVAVPVRGKDYRRAIQERNKKKIL
jgi:DNA replication protein DnaC